RVAKPRNPASDRAILRIVFRHRCEQTTCGDGKSQACCRTCQACFGSNEVVLEVDHALCSGNRPRLGAYRFAADSIQAMHIGWRENLPFPEAGMQTRYGNFDTLIN